jgi:hypothetical protein
MTGRMPNMQLTRSEAADISAYISTLRLGHTQVRSPSRLLHLYDHCQGRNYKA